MAAIEAGKDIALANKETLIAGGPFVLPLARKHKVKILPADSEHSAIFQVWTGTKMQRVQFLFFVSLSKSCEFMYVSLLYNFFPLRTSTFVSSLPSHYKA